MNFCAAVQICATKPAYAEPYRARFDVGKEILLSSDVSKAFLEL